MKLDLPKQILPELASSTFWRPEDSIYALYLGGIAAYAFITQSSFEHWQLLLLIHSVALLLLLLWVRLASYGHSSFWSIFRHWYALLYIPAAYIELVFFEGLIRAKLQDGIIKQIDESLFSGIIHLYTKLNEQLILYDIAELIQFGSWIIPVAVLWLLYQEEEHHREFHILVLTLGLGTLFHFTLFLLLPVEGPGLRDSYPTELNYALSSKIHELIQGIRIFKFDGISCYPVFIIWGTIWCVRKFASVKMLVFLLTWGLLSLWACTYLYQYYFIATILAFFLGAIIAFYTDWVNEWWESKSKGVMLEIDVSNRHPTPYSDTLE